jgi:hypothetical protein
MNYINYFIYSYKIMDTFTLLFWFFSLLFIILSLYLLRFNKKTNIFYLQIASGCGMFATSKIGRNFLGLV